MTSLDAATKLRVRDTLLTAARQALAATEGHIRSEEHAAELDQNEPTAADDISQTDEAGDLHGLFEGTAEYQEGVIDTIEELDFAPTDTVGPGALVGFGGGRFVVGVAAAEFEVDGETWEGISADAPILDAMSGKQAGERFEFNDQQHEVEFVV